MLSRFRTRSEQVSALNLGQTLYLELLRKVLTRTDFPEEGSLATTDGLAPDAAEALTIWMNERSVKLIASAAKTNADREVGKDWPAQAETMIGAQRLEHLQMCVVEVVSGLVPGDLIETGVWRGGATILMRGVLRAMDDRTRKVWVADSFQGLPKPKPDQYPADRNDRHWLQSSLAVSLEEVKENFRRFDLLDDQVEFLPGWFGETLKNAPIRKIAVLRVDGDMYESTIQVLDALFPKVSSGGFVIIDDYGAIPACKEAVDEYRSENGISDELVEIDWTGVFWKKTY